MGKTSPVVQGRGKFTPPKSAGVALLQCIRLTSAKRRRQPGDNLRKTKRFSFRLRLSSVPRRQRRNQRLFWRGEFAPPLDMVGSPNSPMPRFFHSFRGMKEDFRAFQKTKRLPKKLFLGPQFHQHPSEKIQAGRDLVDFYVLVRRMAFSAHQSQTVNRRRAYQHGIVGI